MAHLRKTRMLPNTNIFLWIYRHFLLALYLSLVDLNPLKIINYLTHCNHNIPIPIWGDWERNFSYQKVKAANSINFNALSALVLSHWKPKKKCFYLKFENLHIFTLEGHRYFKTLDILQLKTWLVRFHLHTNKADISRSQFCLNCKKKLRATVRL